MSRKKLQITVGVKAAKYEWILLTEPACMACREDWLASMTRQCQEPNHLVLGYVSTEESCKSVRRFDMIRKAYYLLRRAQRSYGYRTNMPNVIFRKSDFMREQGYQGNLEYVRGEYDFLVNKYALCGDTAVELAPSAWLQQEAPTDKSWHNKSLYLQASRKSLNRNLSMRTLMFFDHLFPHLSLIASIAALACSVVMKDWILTGCAGFALLLLIVLRTIIATGESPVSILSFLRISCPSTITESSGETSPTKCVTGEPTRTTSPATNFEDNTRTQRDCLQKA